MSPSATDESHTSSPKSEKKHKRVKSEHKKRAREEDESAVIDTTPRKSKKPKSEKHAIDSDSDVEVTASSHKKEKKSKKEKRMKEEEANEQQAEDPAAHDESKKERKKSKKHKKHQQEEEAEDVAAVKQVTETLEKVSTKEERRKEKKSKKDRRKQHEEQEEAEAEAEVSMMDVDPAPAEETDSEPKEKKKKKDKKEKKKRATSPEVESMELDRPELSIRTKHKSKNTTKLAEVPSDPQFPFFTQTTSIYVPFFPIGFDKPLTSVAEQHLEPLLNHYSTTLKGVLLKYSNLHLSERPTKASLTNSPTDQTPALLVARDEYAVGFGFLTFDALLFKPARGKWMEGVLQLQSEGHIGVVCWGKFNASIEAKRLPKGWQWIDLDKPKTNGSSSLPSPSWDGDADPDANGDKQSESDNLDGEELQVVEQIHSTGYWVDERGRKITGKLRFRIKNYDVGLAGDYGYLSIEGTFLDDEAEQALATEEREKEKRRRATQNPTGNLRPLSRRVPEFSVTKFGKEEEEEDSQSRVVYHKGSRPGTPDN